jgi:Calx-beta domain/Metallo-peptidase family M12B Reprolysin-like
MQSAHHGGWRRGFTSSCFSGVRQRAIGFGLLVLLSVAARAQDPLFEDAPPQAVLSAKRLPSAPGAEEGARRSRVVRIDPSRLRDPGAALHQPSPAFQKRSASRLRLNLFPDLDAVLHVERTDFLADGRFVARGVVEGEPDSLVLISADGDVMAATISIPGREAIKVRYLGEGLHEVVQLDSTQFRPCNPLVPDLSTTPGAVKSKDSAPTTPRASGAKAAKTVLDIMVVYTGAARAGAGGDAGIRSLINLAVAEANDTYVRSLIDAELNLVYAGEAAYTESGDANTDLTRLQNPSDGQLDAVHALRNQYGADIVCLFTEAMNYYAGLGYVMNPPRTAFADYAFSVVRRMYANGQYVFAHEVGHNLGCQHDRNNANTTGSYAYSYGNRFTANGTTYRTVMAYAPGVPIPYFSNPSVAYQGVATGVPAGQATAADNAQTINLTAPVAAGFRGQGTVVQFESAAVSVSEGVGNATVNVVRSGDVSRSSTVWYAVANGTAVSGSDFTAVATTQLTFNAGETNKSITIPILDDAVVESPETIRINLGQPAGATLGSVSVTVLTINDNDSVVAMAATSATVVENAGSVRVEVRRAGTVSAGATVAYTTIAGTATAGADYQATSGTLTFAAGDTNAFITVPIVDDSTVEAAETFTVRLSSPAGTLLGTPTDTVVQIAEDDCRVTLAAATASVVENAGQLVVTVARSGGTASTATVAYATADGTATAGSDYGATSGTLQFNPGETTKSFTVPILNDAVAEPAETFTVTLSSPSGGAQAGTTMSTTVTVVDNDSAIGFDLASDTVLESAGTKAVTVRRTGSLNTAATVQYAATGGTATPAADYTLAAGVLTFAAGESTKAIGIPIVNDLLVEGTETVVLTLSGPTGEAVLGANSVQTLSIQDNDLFTFALSPATATVSEAGGSVRFTVSRTGTIDAPATVLISTRDVTARAGADYTAVNVTVSFAAGEASKTVDVAILNDTVIEGTETFGVLLATPTGGGVLGTATSAVVSILEDDVAFALSATAYTVGENTNSVVLVVSRTGNTNAAVSVDYATADGTATAGADYTQATGTLSFASGEVVKTFSVPILDDSSVEPTETFTARLLNPVGGALGTPGTATVSILEDDCLLQFASTNYPVAENAGRATVVVQRVGGTLRSVGATVRTSDGTATAGADYTATATGIVFAPGETSKSVVIPVLNDAAMEPEETVAVGLDTFSGTSAGTPSTTTVRILDNDSEFNFYANRSFPENAARAEVWVTRTGGVITPATVRYSTANGTATAGSDYTASSGLLSFAAGETTKQVLIPLLDDLAVEGDEAFTVVLSQPTGEAVLGTTSTATVTLVENDLFSVGFSATTATVAEDGGSVRLTVTRTGNTSGAATVVATTRNETALAGADYTAVNTAVSFAANETSKTVDIPILNDTAVEANETFLVVLSAPTGGGVLGSATTARVTIVENDIGFALTATAVAVGENTNSVVLSVRRSGDTNAAVSVDFATADGTATAGADYTAATGTLGFASGEVLKTLSVTILNDTAVEGNETFSVRLLNPVGGLVVAPTNAVVTILEDDCQLRFSTTNYTVLENAGVATLVVQREGGALVPVSVTVKTADGTATAGSDYAATTVTVSLAAGVASANVTIPVVNDAVIDPDETVNVSLESPVGCTVGTPATAVLTIRNTDSEFAFYADRSFPENAARAEVWITRTGGILTPATVRYATVNGTATAGADYVAASGVLSFAAGEAAKQLLVTLRDDTIREPNEVFYVDLSAPTGEATLGTLSRVTVTLVDNDGGAGAVVDGLRLSVRRPEGKSVPELRIVGPEGSRARLESSTNLTTWLPRGTLTLETGEAVWAETDDAPEGRFYRAVAVEPPGNP